MLFRALLWIALGFGCAGHSEGTLFQDGKTAFADGDLRRAQAAFEEQISRHPQGIWSLAGKTYLSRIQLKQGDAAGALRTLDDGLATAPADALGRVTAQYWRGRIALVLRRDAEALTAFSQVAASGKSEAEPATYFEGRALYRVGAFAASVAVLSARRSAVPKPSFANGTQYWLGRGLYATGQCDQAVGELAKVSPDSTWRAGADLYTLRCDLQLERATPETVSRLRQFGVDHPVSQLSDLAELLEGEAMVQVQDFASARATLTAFPTRFPSSSYLDAAAFWSARAAVQLGQCPAARAELSAQLARRPTNNPFAPGIHLSIGECFYREGALDRSQVELESLVARTPTSRWVPEAYFALARLNADLGQCATARTQAAAIPAASPWSAKAAAYLTTKGC